MNKLKSEKNQSKNQTSIESVDFKGYQPVTKEIFEERLVSLVTKRREKFEKFKEAVMVSMVKADATDDAIEERLERLENEEVVNAGKWLLGELEHSKPEFPLRIVSKKDYEQFKARADIRIEELRKRFLHASLPEEAKMVAEPEGVYTCDSDRPEQEA